MSALLRRHLAALEILCITLLLAWCCLVLVLFWHSGEPETREAFHTGKRFIVHILDGRVEGASEPEKQDEKVTGEAVILAPPVSEPEAEVAEEINVTASSNPTPSVSEDLLDKTGGAPLPKIAESGVQPWQYYAKTFRRQNEFPLVAIIITGLGQSRQATELAFGMDDRISLSFSPYAGSVASWADAARRTGHEKYVDLPMQTAGFPNDDRGPHAVMIAQSNSENLKNLYWAMSRFHGYVGMVAPLGEVVTGNADTFVPLAKEMAKRGVMMLGQNSFQPTSKAKEAGKDAEKNKPEETGLITMNADVWLDEELTEMAIQARLATLEQAAQRNGYAIGIARGYPLSINQIKQWQETLGERGVVLAPVSFISKLKH